MFILTVKIENIQFNHHRAKITMYLFMSLAASTGISNRADDAGACQRVVSQEPRAVGEVVAVRVRAGVGIGHGGDDGGLHHPLQVLAGCDGVYGGYEGTAGAGHVDPVLLERENQREREREGWRTMVN